MKRSNTVRLLLLGLMPLALSACDGTTPAPQTEASGATAADLASPTSVALASPPDWGDTAFKSVAECVAAGNTTDICQKAEDQAKAADLASAPRFKTREACIAEYGADMCQSRHDDSGGGSDWFGPFAAGFLVSHLFFNNHDYSAPAQPLYRRVDGQPYRPSSAAAQPSTASGMAGSSYARSPFASRPSTWSSPSPSSPVAATAPTVTRGGFGPSSSPTTSPTSTYGSRSSSTPSSPSYSSSPSRSSSYSSSSSSRSFGG